MSKRSFTFADMKNVLITGGVGFIGSNLVKALAGPEYNVDTIDWKISSRQNHYWGSVQNFLKSWEKPYDIIFHLAADARIQPSFDNPAEVIENNVNATLAVAEYARKHNSKVVFATTSSSQGGEFASPYTMSKVMSEKILQGYSEIYGLDISIARFFNVYGPGEPENGEYATVVAKFLKLRREGLPLTIVGDGKQTREFTHVQDICEGLIKLSSMPCSTKIFDLASGKGYSINRIVHTICGLAAKEGKDYVYVPLRKREAQKIVSNWINTYHKIGWRAKYSLTDYINQQL